MEVKASLKNLQTAPRKVRLVADLIRGASVAEARHQLQVSTKKVAKPMLKLVNSAVANATNNHGLNPESLVVKSIHVDHGRTLKRFQPRAFGRAGLIRKRASHIHVVLEGEEMASKPKAAPKKKVAKKAKEEKPAAKNDMEKQAPKKVQGKKAASKKSAPEQEREKGHETKTNKK